MKSDRFQPKSHRGGRWFNPAASARSAGRRSSPPSGSMTTLIALALNRLWMAGVLSAPPDVSTDLRSSSTDANPGAIRRGIGEKLTTRCRGRLASQVRNCNFGQSRRNFRGREDAPQLSSYACLSLDDQRRPNDPAHAPTGKSDLF